MPDQLLDVVQNLETQSFPLESMFKVKILYPDVCTGTDYMLSSTPDKYTAVSFKTHRVDGKSFIIDPSKKEKQVFYLMARQTKSFLFATIKFEINVTNKNPNFVPALPITISVDVTKDSDGKVKGDSKYQYDSPPLQDGDGH